MTYIGYPVEFEELQRLCVFTPREYCSRYFLNCGLNAYLTDKDQWVIGVKLAIGDAGEPQSANSTIIRIIEAQETVKKANIDLSSIKIYGMEEEPVVMCYPDPFFIVWNN